MKKIAILIAAVAFMATANAQLVVGLQGGYYQQRNTNTLNADFTYESDYLGGLRIGYMVTPKLYVGVAGAYLSMGTEQMIATDSAAIAGMIKPTHDHHFTTDRSGWSVSPQIRWEFLKYGNMHFHLLLQGTYRKMGYTNHTESFIWDVYPNPNEYCEPVEPWADSVANTSWSVSLRPTLTYEFSKHLSAELSLDFLSVGYLNDTELHDGVHATVDGNDVTLSRNTTTLYAGLNTLMETLRWESPMLRLGFNWTF